MVFRDTGPGNRSQDSSGQDATVLPSRDQTPGNSVRISHVTPLSERLPSLETFIPKSPLPPGRNIFDTTSMKAEELLSISRTRTGVTHNPTGYLAEKAELGTQWLYRGSPELGETHKRALLTAIVKILGEDKLLEQTSCPPRPDEQKGEGELEVDNLARFIANTERELVDADPLGPEDCGIDQALTTIQDQYLRNATVSHFALADTAPTGYEFIPPDSECPRPDDGRVESELAKRDKVSDRRVAEEIGILRQPAFLDTRDFNRPLPVVNYSHVDLREFPRGKEVRTPVEGENKIVILENLWKGFAIFHLEGKVFLSSFNPKVATHLKNLELDQPHDTIEEKKFNEILGLIEKLPNFGTRTLVSNDNGQINQVDHRSFDANALAKLISEHDDGPLYLKSARTAGGKSILKIFRDPSEGLVIESNSPEVTEKYSSRLTRLSNFTSRPDTPLVIVEHAVKLLEPATFLRDYAIQIEAPILEAGIPMAPCKGGRAEARIIYQADNAGTLERTGAYCKFSQTQVAANVSLGGHGMAVDEAIHHILIGQGVDAKDIPHLAKDTLERLTKDVDAFAHEYRNRKGESLREFAVDVAFVWNDQTAQVDFYLIEIQRGFAFEGLKQVDPEAAQVVEQRRTERLAAQAKVARVSKILDLLFGS